MQLHERMRELLQRHTTRRTLLKSASALILAACSPQYPRVPARPTNQPTAVFKPEASPANIESDKRVITRAAAELAIPDVDKNGEMQWMQFPMPQGSVNATLVYMDGTRNTELKNAGLVIQSQVNPTAPIGLNVQESLPGSGGNKPLTIYFVGIAESIPFYIIAVSNEEARRRSNHDIALEFVLNTASIAKYKEQYEKADKNLPPIERRDTATHSQEAAIERNMHSYAEVSRAIIRHVALVGNTNGISQQRISDAARFVEAGQDENSQKWREFALRKFRQG